MEEEEEEEDQEEKEAGESIMDIEKKITTIEMYLLLFQIKYF